ncbi:NUDIX hydrolase [Demequina globuliformis]|uniref:NUDIX hydrolase n=1 Tax=Demequina globuliformis TaxID=676202 RepID=UPI000780D961|nr:NUDIX domain-containing protein [Demequina globuliformis]
MTVSDRQPRDGERIERYGARVLLLDGDRLLMLRGHDPHQPSRSWWFTPGGGVEPGESERGAAVRELAEETGFVLAEHELAGPVWRRTALFDFFSRQYVQHEVFFVARREDAERRSAVDQAWTVDEQEVIDGSQWVTLAELADAGIEVFPARLSESWADFDPWDGVARDLGVEPE